MATIKGKWAWNDYISFFPLQIGESLTATITLKSNGKDFSSITVGTSFTGYALIFYEETEVIHAEIIYDESGNYIDTISTFDEAYRVMDFGATEQQLDDDIYDRIIANAHELNISDKLEIIVENQQKVFDAGKQAEYDAFWDAFQNGGNRTYYGDAFRGAAFEYVHPKHKITPKDKGGASRIFYDCEFLKKAEAAYIDLSQIPRGSHISETYYNTFTMCYELEEVEDIGFVPTFGYGSTFAYCLNLRKVAMIRVDVDTQFSNDTFVKCTELEEITFKGEIGSDINFQWSTKLTRASIENIINHLSDNVSGKTLTLSKAAVDDAFVWTAPNPDGEDFEYGGLEEGSGNEWYPLVASKPNWQITLV